MYRSNKKRACFFIHKKHALFYQIHIIFIQRKAPTSEGGEMNADVVPFQCVQTPTE